MSSFVLFLSLLAATAAEPVEKTQEQPNPPAKSAEVIVVTATRSERELSTLPVSTAVIPERELEVIPAARVDDVLRSIPGVQLPVASSNALFATQARISMHGLGDISALVLLDGIPLHDPFDGTVQWGKVPVDGLQQVEVVRGASASLFGNYALGGAVNLLTRPVSQSGATADLSAGSLNTTRGSLTLDHMVTDDLGLRLSHSRAETDGFKKAVTPGPVDIGAWSDYGLTGLRADWSPSTDLTAFAKSNWSQVDVSNGTPLSFSKRDLFDAAAGMHRTIGSSTLVSATVFRQTSDENLVVTSVPATRATESVTSDSTIPGTSNGGSLEWSHHRSGPLPLLSLGLDVQRIESVENRTSFRNGVVTRRNLVEGSQLFAGLFGQVSWRPSDRVEVLTSVRVDHYRNSNGSDAIVGGAVTKYPEKTSTELDPRVSMRVELARGLAARASVYRAFKAPTLRRLYRATQFGTTVLYGNPDLDPEILVGGEVGLEWVFGRTRAELNVYRSDVEGYQVSAPIPGQPANVTQYVNLGETRSDGVEAIVRHQLSRSWSMEAGYTYTDSLIVDDPDPALEGNRLPDLSMHQGNLAVRYLRDGGTSVYLRGRLLSSSYADEDNLVVQPAHTVFDLSVVQPVRSWLDVYARVENLFDESYYYVTANTRRPGGPRVVTGGVRVRLPLGPGRSRG